MIGIPESVNAERRSRCNCDCSEGELHKDNCRVWPHPRWLYRWLSSRSRREFYTQGSGHWDRLFTAAVFCRHPLLWRKPTRIVRN